MLSNTRCASNLSSRCPPSYSVSERAHSSTSITTKANTTINVSMTSVRWLRLLTTLSYTSSMYTVGTSISSPPNSEKPKAFQKNGESDRTAICSSVGGFF